MSLNKLFSSRGVLSGLMTHRNYSWSDKFINFGRRILPVVVYLGGGMKKAIMKDPVRAGKFALGITAGVVVTGLVFKAIFFIVYNVAFYVIVICSCVYLFRYLKSTSHPFSRYSIMIVKVDFFRIFKFKSQNKNEGFFSSLFFNNMSAVTDTYLRSHSLIDQHPLVLKAFGSSKAKPVSVIVRSDDIDSHENTSMNT